MSEPLVSVVVPTRDRAASLDRAVQSVLDQDYAPVELIVVDNGSTDGTRDVLAGYGDRLRVLSQPYGNAYHARNLALHHARGDLVAFLDSDDAWRPHKLSQQVPLFQDPAVGLVFGDAELRFVPEPFHGRRPRTCFEATPPARGAVLDGLARGNFVPTVTTVVRRRCLDEVGGFPTSHAISADYLTWWRIAARHLVDYVPDVVADYTVHAEGISYQVVPALVSRVELFRAELDGEADPRRRDALRAVLVGLGANLAWALLRSGPRGPAARRAVRTAWTSAPPSQALRDSAIMVRSRTAARRAWTGGTDS